jgi:tetratricopeptide (TPR) repeat protein
VTEPTIDQALKKGIEAYKSGEVQEADRLYTTIIKAHPKHPDANHNMGVLAVGLGKVQEALPFFKTALEANPAKAQFWLSYIDALIKHNKLAEAKTVFDQAKSKGAKGEGFDELGQRLQEAAQEPPKSSKIVSEPQLKQQNILDSLKLDQAIKLAKKKAKEGALQEARRVYQDILVKFPKNKRASDGIKALAGSPIGIAPKAQDPPQAQLQSLINLHSQGQIQQALKQSEILAHQYPRSAVLLNIQGAFLKGLRQLNQSIAAYNKALTIKPDFAEAYYNMSLTLEDQGKLEEAIEAYKKAIAIKSDYADAYFNMANALREQGKLEESIVAYNKSLAIKPDNSEAQTNLGVALKDQGMLKEALKAYKKALAINPDNAKAYSNMGNALKEQGKLEEAIEAYKKTLELKSDYADVYCNIGVTLREQGKLKEAIEAYKKALTLKPDYAEAYRHLSSLTKYTHNDPQISIVDDLLQRQNLNESDRCNLHYTSAKMKEDLGDLSVAFDNFVSGGALRKKLLKYEFEQDQHLFTKIKNTLPQFKDVAVCLSDEAIVHTPIFILGMPRSGTSLVEQIVSSHTEVTGAGELHYVSQFGRELAAGTTAPTVDALLVFRERYLTKLSKRADGQAFITDKMPQNFLYIALICAAFPEAKIVHVQRNAKATCWSNFKHYFASKNLGYSYNIRDTVRYYKLYVDLMNFCNQSYRDHIYNLNYDQLTENQEPETRRLIEYLELNWEDACLAPQKNERSVKTASQQQIRQKVYQGSSQAWRKYEPFLDGVFDELEA